MRTDFYYDSCGAGKIHGCRWTPEGQITAVVQIVHGIAEYVERYDAFAEYLNSQGILVVAEDHMGHGKSIDHGGTKGFFDGGWSAAVEDSCRLIRNTGNEFPGVPFILFGHSMGSFMARTILCKHPDMGLAGAVICGTGWMPDAVIGAGKAAAGLICKIIGERTPSDRLQNMIFGGYNKKIEHPRTSSDWLSRDNAVVDAYEADPMCGFTVCCGLLRDMMSGMAYNQKPENLARMKKDLPVLFIAGGEDPVGDYGKSVLQAADKFREYGMQDVTHKIYPLCRHEILNEINRQEVFGDIHGWIQKKILN